MSNPSRALDESLELLHRFEVALSEGLLSEIRQRRQSRSQPWEREDDASRDLRRIGALVRLVFTYSDELVTIAAKYERNEHRQAG